MVTAELVPSTTPQGYMRPRTLLPFTSSIVLLPTTANGMASCTKNETLLNNIYLNDHSNMEFGYITTTYIFLLVHTNVVMTCLSQRAFIG